MQEIIIINFKDRDTIMNKVYISKVQCISRKGLTFFLSTYNL